MNKTGKIHIGTSGWHYDHWRGPFYPEELSKDEWLDYYVQHFHTAEINNTFYQLPSQNTLESWRERAPEGFIFSVKASRYITHMKKLKDPDDPLGTFLGRIKDLGKCLGPILFQLPPNWNFNGGRLRSFLQALPKEHRYTFEFRDPSWLVEEAYRALRQHAAALCIYDFAGRMSPTEVTADFVYVRLHGPEGAYVGSYDDQSLAGWAGAFSTWSSQGKEVFCYFDNDQFGYAAQDAARLLSMLSGQAV